MTTSAGRIARLAAGVIAAALGIALLILGSPAASADGSTQQIQAHNVTSDGMCEGDVGAQFVINQIDGGPAPSSITVYVNGSSIGTLVTLTKESGGVAHYNFYFETVGDMLTKATAEVYAGWGGEFNLSDCLTGMTPSSSTMTTTASQTTGTTLTTATTTHTTATTTHTTATTATTSITTRTTVTTPTAATSQTTATTPTTVTTQTTPTTVTTQTTPTTSTTQTTPTTLTTATTPTTTSTTVSTSSSSTQTTTPSTSSTAGTTLTVAGESSEMTSPQTITTSPILVMGESSSIGAGPSANAHTGQSWGILPYLLLGGGLLLVLTGIRIRRRSAHH